MMDRSPKPRRTGIPTGNAGEYFVMGECLRRGWDAQLADRNTKGYDLLLRQSETMPFQPVQVKTVRAAPWYVQKDDFSGERPDKVTVYVLIGPEDASQPVRYFIARNSLLGQQVHHPKNQEKWTKYAFMPMKAVQAHENQWAALFPQLERKERG